MAISPIAKNRFHTTFKISTEGSWVVQSVKWPTLDLGLGHELTVHEVKPQVRVCTDSAEPAWDSLSPSLPLLHSCSLSLKIQTDRQTDRQTIITERPSSRLPCIIMASLLQNHPNIFPSSRLPKLFLIPLEAAYRPVLHCVNCWLWEIMGDGVMKIFYLMTVVITWLYMFVRSYKSHYLVSFVIYKLYINKSDRRGRQRRRRRERRRTTTTK